jgi:hypothetical protein
VDAGGIARVCVWSLGVCVDAGGIVWMLEALHGGLTVGRLARPYQHLQH